MTHVPGAGRVIRMLALARSYNDLTLRDPLGYEEQRLQSARSWATLQSPHSPSRNPRSASGGR
jgi:hypothetical protein